MDAHQQADAHRQRNAAAAAHGHGPSLFDCNEHLDRSLRSRHLGERWFAEVEAKLHAYRACMQRHVRAAEGDRGWIASLRDAEPRVEPLARRTRADFGALDEQVLATMAALRTPWRDERELRHRVRRLVDATRRHRSRCAQLVYETCHVDLGLA